MRGREWESIKGDNTTVYVGTTLNKITIETKKRAHRPASNDDTTHGSEREEDGTKRQHRETAVI